MKIVAERVLEFRRGDLTAPMRLYAAIWEPTESRDDPKAPIWTCQVAIEGDNEAATLEFIGVDSFQALATAIFHVAVFLARHSARGEVSWPQGGRYHPDQDVLFSEKNATLHDAMKLLQQRMQRQAPGD